MHKIELLAKTHDRDGFDCGSEPLNLFLKQTARQHAERGISRTFVLVDEAVPAPKPIVGFFSLNICQIKSESLTPQEAKKLPREVAGVRLGRLAVAKANQRQGIGKALLVAAMGKFIEIFNTAGGLVCSWTPKTRRPNATMSNLGLSPCLQMNWNYFCRSKRSKRH